MFQVAVGHIPSWIVTGDEAPLNVRRELMAPHVGSTGRVVDDPTHAGFGGVRSSQHGRLLWYDLGKARGAVTEASRKSAEGIKAVPHETVDSHTVMSGFVLCPLQGAEQTGRTGNGD